MRLTWIKLRAGAAAQHEAKYKELGQPVPGLRARWIARVINDPDAIFGVSLWDSVEAIRAWESSEHYTKVYLPTLRPLLEGEYTVSICEVRNVEGL